jgi:hypothetical protein
MSVANLVCKFHVLTQAKLITNFAYEFHVFQFGNYVEFHYIALALSSFWIRNLENQS